MLYTYFSSQYRYKSKFGLSEQVDLNIVMLGSGCEKVDTRDSRFESNHHQLILFTIVCWNLCCKNENKEK